MNSSSYDQVPYESYPYSKTHPDNLATIGALFGMTPPDVDLCRVLELGCAGGGNLIPMAVALSNSSFQGIDLSRRQVEDGSQVVRELGLSNIQLEHRSILEVDRDWGQFDYIICHGVYSWVSSDVQRKILQICTENLAPNGVAYVSYNTYPGWHMRGMIREMMNFHADGFDDTENRVGQSRALLDFLIKATPDDGSAYDLLLKEELKILQASTDSYLFHEHLEDYNQPIYFFQFVEQAEAAGLRFLAEAEFGVMVPNAFSPEIRETLAKIAPNIIHMEQYMDFLRSRMFRRTLLCHANVRLNREIGPDRVRDLYVSSALVPTEDLGQDPRSQLEMNFQHPHGTSISVQDPLHKGALLYLNQIWPRCTCVDGLPSLSRIQRGVEQTSESECDHESQSVCELVLECFSSDLVELRLRADRFTTVVSGLPETTSLARHQASKGSIVTNLRHETVQLEELDRRTLALLDGTHSIDSLRDELADLVLAGELTIEQENTPMSDASEIKGVIAEALKQIMPKLARLAILIQ